MESITPSVFPLELLHEIVSQIDDKNDLKSLRLTSHSWKTAAEPFLFRSVSWGPRPDMEKRFNALADCDELRRYVRTVHLHTFPKIDTPDVNERISYTKSDLAKWKSTADYERALEAVHDRFTGVHDVRVKFSAQNSGHGHDQDQEHQTGSPLSEALQSAPVRADRMRLLLDAIRRRRDQSGELDGSSGRPVNKLTAVNLLDVASWSEDPIVDDLVRSFTELNFSLRVKRNGRGGADFPALARDQSSLVDCWLRPASQTLTCLSLYMDTYWGSNPCLDLTDLNFPRLKALKLGNYSFLYRSQLDWMTSLTSLEQLYLDDCPIVTLMEHDECLRNPDRQVASHDWQRCCYDDHSVFYTNNAKWCQYFELIGDRLTNLKDFRYGHGDEWNRKVSESGERICSFWHAFEARDQLRPTIHSTRYVSYIVDNARRLWAEAEVDHPTGSEWPFWINLRLRRRIKDDEKIPTLPEEDRVKDDAALRQLLSRIERRAGR